MLERGDPAGRGGLGRGWRYSERALGKGRAGEHLRGERGKPWEMGRAGVLSVSPQQHTRAKDSQSRSMGRWDGVAPASPPPEAARPRVPCLSLPCHPGSRSSCSRRSERLLRAPCQLSPYL